MHLKRKIQERARKRKEFLCLDIISLVEIYRGINKNIKIKIFYAMFTVTNLVYLIYNLFTFPIHQHIVKFLGIM